ncbi:hypothetical protein [Phreatobacter cathodiphilus]|uniref:Uncharacterized protein n=1 Tax=Phreatobacter cathodiphilus TaxID=1868589 RepID=A0A2S0N7C8_9HYPH|nr:hypothetical protein [Phreatobacter cathodiphilus]AVO44048.1 hypothetical protein C6569_02635 [Phreatobacter cathodiphilus]
MTQPRHRDREIVSEAITEADIDEVLQEFGGDTRQAVRALLEDIAVLALDRARAISTGFVRGQRFHGAIDTLKLP